MSMGTSSVISKKLPEQLTLETADLFIREIAPMLEQDRPRIVFDFSAVREFDRVGVALLLNCIEEVLKRNGDLKLAAVPALSVEALKQAGVDNLFEIFSDPEEAAESFYCIPEYHDVAESFAPPVLQLTSEEFAV